MDASLRYPKITKLSSWALSALAVAGMVNQAYSQTLIRGGVSGRVLDEASREPVALAVIEIVELARTAETDSLGRFRLVDLEPNLVTVRIKRIGYAPLERSLLLRPGRVVSMDYLLSPSVVELPEVEVEEKVVELNAMMSGFEERRRMGFGTFFDEAEIRRNQHRQLADLLYQTTGVKIIRSGFAKYAANSRRNVSGLGSRGMGPCFMQVVIDGVEFRGGQGPLDLTTFIPLSEVSAIEVYPSVAGLPMQFRQLGSQCGVLIIWTRRGGDPP